MGDRACAVLVRRGRILLVRQRYRGQSIWTFPGGGIAPGETPEAAAIREVREEVGLEIAIERPLRQCPRTGVEGTSYCFLGRILGGRLALGTDPEHPADAQELCDCRWQRLEHVADHREVAPILAEVRGSAGSG